MMHDPDLFLAWTLIVLGGLGLAAGGFALRFADAVCRGLAAFPRSKGPGRVISAICILWVAWVVRHAALGRFEGLKPLVPVIAVVLFIGMVWLLDELLAPRALGGLLLLVANPVLNGVRWAESAWRFVPALMAYAWVIAGCALMLHPWVFRQLAGRVAATPGQVRRLGGFKLVAGAILVVAGVSQLH